MKKQLLKILAVVIAPFAVGLAFEQISRADFFNNALAVAWSIIFFGFWFWAGMAFRKKRLRKELSFVIGNALPVVFIGFSLWTFFIRLNPERSPLIASLASYYGIPGFPLSAQILTLFTRLEPIYTDHVLITSFVLMLIAFSVGFIFFGLPKRQERPYA